MTVGEGRGAWPTDENETFMRLCVSASKYLLARRNDLAPATRRQYRHVLMTIVDALGPDMLVRAVKRKHVERWISELDCSPATIRSRLSVLRNFCEWCLVHGYMKADPTLGIHGPRQPDAMPRELVDDEITRLLKVLPDARAEVIVMLGLVQGLRCSSMTAQLRQDIDLTGRMMLVSYAKGNKQQWLPLLEDTYGAVVAYYRESPGLTGPLLRSETHPGRGLTAGHIGKMQATWMYEAGVKLYPRDGKSGHALRHTRAGTMLDDGADIREVQAALGHASLSSTFIYTRRRQADGKLRDAMGRRRYREAS